MAKVRAHVFLRAPHVEVRGMKIPSPEEMKKYGPDDPKGKIETDFSVTGTDFRTQGVANDLIAKFGLQNARIPALGGPSNHPNPALRGGDCPFFSVDIDPQGIDALKADARVIAVDIDLSPNALGGADAKKTEAEIKKNPAF